LPFRKSSRSRGCYTGMEPGNIEDHAFSG
jgi:hypothetical protein